MSKNSEKQGSDVPRLALSVQDTGDALGVHRCSVYNLIRSGRLQAFKIGTRTLVTMESIEALIGEAQQSAEA